MKRLIAACAVVALVASGAAAEEQWLQYRTSSEPGRAGMPQTYRSLKVSAHIEDGVKPPAGLGADARFARWETPMAPAGAIWLALDRSKPSIGYDRLYIDADADGDLSDESAIAAARATKAAAAFTLVKVVFPSGDGPVTYHLNLSVQSGGSLQVAATAACWYDGAVRIAGREYRCTLVDANTNGLFDDRAGKGGKGDLIGLGRPPEEPYALTPLSGYIIAGGTVQSVAPARDGACVSFAEATDVPTGRVRAEGVTSLSLTGDVGQIRLVPADGVATVPAGAWRTQGWTIARKDAGGAEWTLAGFAPANAKAFEVPAGGEVEVKAGEPVTASLVVRKSGSSYSFTESLTGQSGERVQLLKQGGLPPAPKLRIRNKSGSYDKVLTFSYG